MSEYADTDPPPPKKAKPPAHERWGTLYARGSPTDELSDADLAAGLRAAPDKIGAREKVLLLPPDITRLMSKAGELACAAHAYYGGAVADVMPALGTHAPMTPSQIAKMYPTIPPALFREHDWRDGTVAVGTVPAADVRELTGGAIDSPWTATLNALVARGGHDLVLSMGQVVPHEALGMANYTKNLFIGVAGAETINFTHHIMAVYGVENVMGRASNPGRALFDRAFDAFCPELPALFAMTVVGTKPDGARVTRGFYVGDTSESFGLAARLSLEVNFTMVDEPHAKVVCLLDAHEYAFTWTANKAIYRTRLMVADGGELVVLAPGVRSFGERETLDRLIRKCERATSARERARARARLRKPDPPTLATTPPPHPLPTSRAGTATARPQKR